MNESLIKEISDKIVCWSRFREMKEPKGIRGTINNPVKSGYAVYGYKFISEL